MAYNQPPHPSFYVGDDMDDPPVPDVELISPDGTVVGPTPDAPTVPADTYQVVNENSGHVLEVAAGADADGATVRQGADEDLASQRWQFDYVGDGAYEIVNAASGKALDVSEGATDSGGNVVQWTPNGNDNQQWYVERNADGTHRLIARHSGLVLAVRDASTADEANVIQWEWLENDDQRWRLEPVTDRTSGRGPTTVEGAGADVWGTEDAGHFYSTAVAGDFDVSVRAASVENTHEYAKAGLMVRASMDPGARNAMIRRTPSATSFQWRSDAGGETVSLTSGATTESEVTGGTTDHRWQRLVRDGDVLRAYTSPDGSDWQLLSEISLPLPTDVHLGLAVTSHAAGTPSTARFEELVGVTPTAARDIGAVEVAGGVTTPTPQGPPALNGTEPGDPDDDGLYEDLTGNGEVDNQDVVAYFQHMGDGGYLATNRQYFDYTGNGDIDYQDLIQLFGQIG